MRSVALTFLLAAAPLLAQPDADQTIRVRPPSYKLYLDQDFELDAWATSGLPVSFSATGDCSVRGSTVHILGAGKCLVTARQPGNERYRPAPNVELRIPIGKAGQTIEFPQPPARTYLDPDLELDGSASSGLPLTYFAYGDCEANGPYLRVLAAGECTVTAHQAGNDNYTAARIVERRFEIEKAEQTIAFRECPSCGNGLLPYVPVASSGLPVGLQAYGACAAGISRVHIIATGLCTVVARQRGSANFHPTTLERSFQVVYVE